jgi:hypothetical protein
MIAQQSRYVLAIENPSWLGSGENANDRRVDLVGPYLNRALAGRHADRPLQHAKALEAAGSEYAHAGDRDAAQSTLASAAEIYAWLGATVDAARVRAARETQGVQA